VIQIENGYLVDWKDIDYKGNYRVYIQINEDCRALIIDKSNSTFPLLFGQFPPENTYGAIVGRNVEEKLTSDIISKRTLEYLGKEFVITGVVGAAYPSSCDDLIILFGLDYNVNEFRDNPIIIDVETKGLSEFIMDELVRKYPELDISSLSARGTARLADTSFFTILLNFEIFFLVISVTYIIGKYRYSKFNGKRKTLFILGIPSFIAFLREEVEILLLNIFSLSIAICLINLLKMFPTEHIHFVLFEVFATYLLQSLHFLYMYVSALISTFLYDKLKL